jgi:RNA polymerase sigma-70 factor (ECF subfamily)
MNAPEGTPSASGQSEPLDFRKLFDAEVHYVWKTLRRLGVKPSDVEDVANVVWMTVHRRLDTYDRTRPVRPWLFGIAFRVALAEKRIARNRYEVLAADDGHADTVPSEAPAPDEQLSARDAHRLVLAALQSIDVDRRAIFVMHDMDETPMNEISATLGVPINTAYSRLRLARSEFKAAVIRLRKGRST